MSSPEELTFVVGRWLRPIVVVLDVVRRLRSRTTSSREQRRTTQNQGFGRDSFHRRSEGKYPPPSRRILAQGAAGLRRDHIALERGIRQPTTVASTMPPVLSFRQWPSIQRQANGS